MTTITSQNIVIARGDNCLLTVTFVQADGTPVDPTIGSIIKYRMARNWYTTDTLVSKALGSGVTIINNGVTVDLSASDTDQKPGNYAHELKVINGTDVATAMTGAFVIRPSMHFALFASPGSEQLAAAPAITRPATTKFMLRGEINPRK